MKTIWLAGGCFWGVEAYFQQLKGVHSTRVGYGQGGTENPTYHEVCTGTTGYTEVCEVVYDENVLPLSQILEHYFRIVDPTTLNRQGPDIGTQYRSGIYYSENEEKDIIMQFIKTMQTKYKRTIVVEVEAVGRFFLAEDYHQKYLEKTPGGYCHVNLKLVRSDEHK
ncbi:MAG: msrAB [Firmicutes bacterium]|nr:msrAB [Bacillota bacterium]